jgi:carboxypeptidase Taq
MGASDRSEELALISRTVHKRIISDEFWKIIEKLSNAENFEKLTGTDKAVVSRLRKDVEKARKVPSGFVERMAKATTLAYQAWEEARSKNDFKVFSNHLKKIIALEKEYCSFFDAPGSRYNALIDDYEEGMTVEKLKIEFSYLKNELIKVLEKIKTSSIYQNQRDLDIRMEETIQRKLCDILIGRMRLSRDRSRLDVSTHPFTTSIGLDDVRFTTNFKRKNILFSFFSTAHEAGHALYELNIPGGKYKHTVISDSPSLGIHESQSRFWENMIARSKPFWRFFYPIFRKESLGTFRKIKFDDWYKFINQVKPSPVRVEADELTYGLHIILRFEIEMGIIEDKLSVEDLPAIWNEKMDEMLGITPKNDLDGVLQDMHWSGGSFGYFPTYAIGSIYSTQILKKMREANSNLYDDIEKGDFTNIINWLKENIHKYGRLMTADEIIKKSCGEGLNSKIYIENLKEKYFDIYMV